MKLKHEGPFHSSNSIFEILCFCFFLRVPKFCSLQEPYHQNAFLLKGGKYYSGDQENRITQVDFEAVNYNEESWFPQAGENGGRGRCWPLFSLIINFVELVNFCLTLTKLKTFMHVRVEARRCVFEGKQSWAVCIPKFLTCLLPLTWRCSRYLQARISPPSLWPLDPAGKEQGGGSGKWGALGKRKCFSHSASFSINDKEFLSLQEFSSSPMSWIFSHTAVSESGIHTSGGFSLQMKLLMDK